MNYLQFLDVFDVNDSYYMRALYSQSALETGNFTSNLYRNYNNLFGMRPSKSRRKFYDDIYHSGNGDFASYPELGLSLLDRIDLDEYNDIVRPITDGDVEQYYINVASHGYAEADYGVKTYDHFRNIFPNDIPLHSQMLEGVGLENTSDITRPIENPYEDGKKNNNWIWLIIIVLTLGGGFLFFKKRQ